MGPETTKFARIDPGPSHGFNFLASAVADVGLVLVLVSFLALTWFDGGPGGARLDFGDTHRLLGDAGPVAQGLASAYFSWLGWGLLVVTFACALVAAVPTIGRPFRLIAPAVAAVSIAITFLAIDLFGSASTAFHSPSYSDYLDSATVGFWCAVAGFALMGAAAAIGPRRMPR